MSALDSAQEPVLSGEGPAGRQRPAPSSEVIRRRIDRYRLQDKPPEAEGVVPLNAGFFFIQRMRQASKE